MALRQLLGERRAAIARRWIDAVLAEYGEPTATRWRREADPFANPVGTAIAEGLPELLDAVATGAPLGERALAALEGVVRIRAIQQLSPSRAVGFVCALRGALRAELADVLAGGGHAAELREVEAGVERLALVAFDAYVAVREETFRLRQEELRRSVAVILRRFGGGEVPPEISEDVVHLGPPRAPGDGR